MNSDNISAKPKPASFDETMPTAAPWHLRLFNYLLDCIFLAITVSLLLSIFVPEALNDLTSGMFLSLVYALQFGYYLIAEFFFNRTLAKLITKTYVTTEYNEKPGFDAIFIRTLCRFIPFEYLTFLGNGIGWHDKFSKTYVVRELQKGLN